MNVVAFNGSPNKKGNTYHALKIVADELENKDIQVEIIHVGKEVIRGCIACGYCVKNQNEMCVTTKDPVNEWIQKMKMAQGILIGSPVHYAAIGGTMKSFLDRAFYVSSVNKSIFRHKVGASVVAVRRSGGIAAFDQLNNYLNYSEMMIPTSNYWNIIHGAKPGEALQDDEGVQIMRILGKNMAWMMEMVELSNGRIAAPEIERKAWMNFIR